MEGRVLSKALGQTQRVSGAAALVRSVWPVAAVFGLALILQLFVKPLMGDGGSFYAKLLLDIGINAMLAVSLTMVNGFTGQFSIGHAAFMAVGAYSAAVLTYYGSAYLVGGETFVDPNVHGGVLSTMLVDRTREDGSSIGWFTRTDVLFGVSLLAGGLVAAVCGWIVGLPSLRLKGDYLAIVTLGFGEVVRVIIQSQTQDVLYTVEEIRETPVVGVAQLFAEKSDEWVAPLWLRAGGSLGFSGLPFYTSLFWVFLCCGITLIVALRIKYSTFGRAFLSIREDEIASEAMGVNTTRLKVRAFVLSAFFAGVAGGLFAHTSGVQLNAGELGFVKSFDIIIMVVLGGLGSVSGAVLAAAIVTLLPEALRDPPTLLFPTGPDGGASFFPWSFIVLGIVAGVVWWRAERKVRAVLFLAGAVLAWELMRYSARKAGVDLSAYRNVMYAVALILMMILRPRGLLGVKEIWEAWSGSAKTSGRTPKGGGTP